MTDESLSPSATLLSAEEACRRLGVKRSTLYSYVSRGRVRAVETGGRRRLYRADDVDRLAARSAARKGHAAVAVGALRWGDPVLDSRITSVGAEGLAYRGREVAALIADETPFEQVAELLWEARPMKWWPAAKAPRAVFKDGPPLWRMLAAIPTLALADESRHVATAEREHERAREIVVGLVAAATGSKGMRSASVAHRLAAAFAPKFKRNTALIDAALVACADHELNVSTFAARVAASSGADLYACVGAALCAFTGPRHGAAGERVEALIEDCLREGVGAELGARMRRGERLPGFMHPLYPEGDPRTPPLLERARVGRPNKRLRALLEVVDRVYEATGEHPNVDLGCVAVALAIGAPTGAGSLLFGLGRIAGWIAHVLEQRESGALLRPRARYVGPPMGGAR